MSIEVMTSWESSTGFALGDASAVPLSASVIEFSGGFEVISGIGGGALAATRGVGSGGGGGELFEGGGV